MHLEAVSGSQISPLFSVWTDTADQVVRGCVACRFHRISWQIRNSEVRSESISTSSVIRSDSAKWQGKHEPRRADTDYNGMRGSDSDRATTISYFWYGHYWEDLKQIFERPARFHWSAFSSMFAQCRLGLPILIVAPLSLRIRHTDALWLAIKSQYIKWFTIKEVLRLPTVANSSTTI